MSIEHTGCEDKHLEEFEFEGNSQHVIFVESEQVCVGVRCDVYAVAGDSSHDLGIIGIEPGYTTPLQKVLQGTRTVEGYLSGEGQLVITRMGGNQEVHLFNDQTQGKLPIDVKIGGLMQWRAGRTGLTAYEVCFPPYQDGRFENIGQ